MSQLPERYQAAIAPLIEKAREFLEQGEELAPMAFVGNFTTGAVVPTPLFGRGPADKDVAARAVKLLAEQLDADFVFVLMEAYSLRPTRLSATRRSSTSMGRSPTVRRAGGSTW